MVTVECVKQRKMTYKGTLSRRPSCFYSSPELINQTRALDRESCFTCNRVVASLHAGEGCLPEMSIQYRTDFKNTGKKDTFFIGIGLFTVDNKQWEGKCFQSELSTVRSVDHPELHVHCVTCTHPTHSVTGNTY